MSDLSFLLFIILNFRKTTCNLTSNQTQAADSPATPEYGEDMSPDVEEGETPRASSSRFATAQYDMDSPVNNNTYSYLQKFYIEFIVIV